MLQPGVVSQITLDQVFYQSSFILCCLGQKGDFQTRFVNIGNATENDPILSKRKSSNHLSNGGFHGK